MFISKRYVMKINKIKIKRISGFTLIEMLLIMVILSMMLFLIIRYKDQQMKAERIERTVSQIQHIINASLTYYINLNKWPLGTTTWSSLSVLQNSGYLANNPYNNPWAPVLDTATYPASYSLGSDSLQKQLYIITYIGSGSTAGTNARVIAGKLPLAQACKTFTLGSTNACAACTTAAADPCYVVASIGVPVQSLNNAMTVNYVGIVHSGACVKAPTCLPTMEPVITVVPSAIAGITDAPTGSNCNANNIQNCSTTTYPITGYIAYATDMVGPLTQGAFVQPKACGSTTATPNCTLDNTNNITATEGDRYWRVCVGVDTSNGRVSPSGANTNPWGQLSGTMMVFTRCAPKNENLNKNAGFSVYQ
jgi:type II secretory pathway pseudopilin PulG